MLLDLTPVLIPIEIIAGIITVIGVPLSVWSIKVERRLVARKVEGEAIFKEISKQSKEIDEVKKDVRGTKDNIANNHQAVMNKLHAIELQVKDKKDREK